MFQDLPEVEVYRNLHNGLLSVVCGGVVVGHCERIALEQVKFKVSAAGVKRIREERKKSVVAKVCGKAYATDGFKPYKWRELIVNRYCELTDNQLLNIAHGTGYKVFFNPYKWDSFVNKHNSPVNEASRCFINSTGTIVAL